MRRTIEELEAAGAAAITVEDTLLPKPFGATKLGLISLDEAVGKMRAALDARQDPALTIVARSAAAEVTGIEDAIARGRAYQASGVDALFFTGITSRAHIEAITRGLSLPVILGFVPSERFEVADLVACGIRLGFQGGQQPLFAAMRAAHDALAEFRRGTLASAITGLAPRELVADVTKAEAYASYANEFLMPARPGR